VNQTIYAEKVRALRALHPKLRALDSAGNFWGVVVRARPVPKRPEDHI